MKKSFPIQKPYYYDTKDGIDYFTKLMVEDNPKKLSPKELQDIDKLGKDMKKEALQHHIKEVKQFKNDDSSSYLSDPKQRGTILEIGKLEKDLAPKIANQKIFEKNINRPVKRRNSFDDTVKLNVGNKGPLKLPELTPEEIERAKRPSDWDVIYASMTPFEKGQWNNEQRREKLRREKDFPEEEDKKTVTKVPLSPPEKPRMPLRKPFRPTPPVDVYDVITKSARMKPGLSEDLMMLQSDINKNIKYVLGEDQKEESQESENEKQLNKEETYD